MIVVPVPPGLLTADANTVGAATFVYSPDEMLALRINNATPPLQYCVKLNRGTIIERRAKI